MNTLPTVNMTNGLFEKGLKILLKKKNVISASFGSNVPFKRVQKGPLPLPNLTFNHSISSVVDLSTNRPIYLQWTSRPQFHLCCASSLPASSIARKPLQPLNKSPTDINAVTNHCLHVTITSTIKHPKQSYTINLGPAPIYMTKATYKTL